MKFFEGWGYNVLNKFHSCLIFCRAYIRMAIEIFCTAPCLILVSALSASSKASKAYLTLHFDLKKTGLIKINSCVVFGLTFFQVAFLPHL